MNFFLKKLCGMKLFKTQCQDLMLFWVAARALLCVSGCQGPGRWNLGGTGPNQPYFCIHVSRQVPLMMQV